MYKEHVNNAKVISTLDEQNMTSRAGSCASELQLKVNCRLKVNGKDFLQILFTIHFTCSESRTLSKLNCSHQKSFVTHVFVTYK